MVTFSPSTRPSWALDWSIDVPSPHKRRDPARILRQRLARGEVTLPERLPSTDLLRTDIARERPAVRST
jgi:hypothetical protein